MKEDQRHLLSLITLPGRLTVEQTACFINCQPHDIPILVAARLLKPLGNPPPTALKFFATRDIIELIKDRAWLAKVTNAIYLHWREQNQRRKNGLGGDRGTRPGSESEIPNLVCR